VLQQPVLPAQISQLCLSENTNIFNNKKLKNPWQENRSPVLITYNLANRVFSSESSSISESWDKKTVCLCSHNVMFRNVCNLNVCVCSHNVVFSQIYTELLHILHILNVFVKWFLNVCSEIVNLLCSILISLTVTSSLYCCLFTYCVQLVCASSSSSRPRVVHRQNTRPWAWSGSSWRAPSSSSSR